MKKLLVLLMVCLCLTTAGVALAQSANVLEVAVSFEGVSVEVPNAGIGFLIPADFVQAAIPPADAEKGVLVNAASPDGAYTLQVTYTTADYDTLSASLKADTTVAGLQDYQVNGVDYLSYTLPAAGAQVGVVFLGENCDQALSFTFLIPQGVNAGSVPLEIMGSLFEL